MILDDLRIWINERLAPWLQSQGVEALPPYALEEPPTGIEADVACNLAGNILDVQDHLDEYLEIRDAGSRHE